MSPESKSVFDRYAPKSGEPAAALPKGNGQRISKDTARKFYDAAGHDLAKAKKLAANAGWKDE